MTDFVIRPVEDAELRAANTLFFGTLHAPRLPDEKWEYWADSYESGRVLGAFADRQLIGTALSWSSGLALPGGGVLPMAAVSGVGVRADHTRRGVLTGLMRTQLAAIADAGQPQAALHASEPVIYGRFGYGVAAIARTTRIVRRRAVLRPDVPPRAGEVFHLDADQAMKLLPAAYERAFGQRPGMMLRSAGWWRTSYESRLRTGEHVQVVVHTGADGPDGFLSYAPREHVLPNQPFPSTWLRVTDFHAASPAVANDLWRYVLGVDLADEIVAYSRPLDEPLEAMLVDQRAVQAEFDDDLWLRLVDVPAALAGRTYRDADPVVIEVRDRLLPAYAGRYRIGPQGVERTTDRAGLVLDVDALAMLYLGSTRASALAGIGRVEAIEPAALARADRLFGTDAAACCGTMF